MLAFEVPDPTDESHSMRIKPFRLSPWASAAVRVCRVEPLRRHAKHMLVKRKSRSQLEDTVFTGRGIVLNCHILCPSLTQMLPYLMNTMPESHTHPT